MAPFSFDEKRFLPPSFCSPFLTVKKSVSPPFSTVKKTLSPLLLKPAWVSYKFWTVPKPLSYKKKSVYSRNTNGVTDYA